MEKLDSYRLEKMVIPRQSGRTTNMINDAINLSISKNNINVVIYFHCLDIARMFISETRKKYNGLLTNNSHKTFLELSNGSKIYFLSERSSNNCIRGLTIEKSFVDNCISDMKFVEAYEEMFKYVS